MSDLPIWAQDKAREWLERKDSRGYPVACPHDEPPVGPQSECPVCLAALLVEVAFIAKRDVERLREALNAAREERDALRDKYEPSPWTAALRGGGE